MSTTNPDPAADRPAPDGSRGPVPEKLRGQHGRPWFHGLGMTYLVGLALLVFGGGPITDGAP